MKKKLRTYVAAAMVIFAMTGISTNARELVDVQKTTLQDNAELINTSKSDEIKTTSPVSETVSKTISVSKSDMKKYQQLVDAGYKDVFEKKITTEISKNGIDSLKKHDFSKAIQNLENAIKINPNGVDAYIYLAEIYRYKNNNEKAMEYAKKALSIDDKNSYANFIIGSVFLNDSADEAVKYLTKAIENDSKLTKAYINRGNAYFDLASYDKSIGDYTKAISLDPQSDIAYYGRSRAYYNSNQYDKAIADNNYLIKKNPKNVQYLFNRALSYTALNNIPMALADINKSVKIEPNNINTYIKRLYIYHKINADKSMIASDVAKIHSLLPNDENKLCEVAELLNSLELYEDALKVGNKVIKINPNNQKIYYTMAKSAVFKKDYQKASELLSTYKTKTSDVANDTDYISGIAKLGLAGRNNKTLLQEGINELNKSIDTGINTAYAYLYRGSAKILLGDYVNGFNDINKYISLSGSSCALAYHQLGYANIMHNWNSIKYDKNGKFVSWESKPLGSYDEFETLVKSYPKDVSAGINYLCSHSDLGVTSNVISLLKSNQSNVAYIKTLRVAYSPTNVITDVVVSPFVNAIGDMADNNTLSANDRKQLLAELYNTKLHTLLGNDDLISKLSVYDIDSYFNALSDGVPKDRAIDCLCDIIGIAGYLASYSDYTNLLQRICVGADNYLRNNYCTDRSITSKYIMQKSNEYLGHIACDNENVDDAVKYYSTAVKYGANKNDLYKNIAFMYINKGDAQYDNNDLESAIYYYNKAVNYGYSKFDVYRHIGNLYYNRSRWFDASDYYTRALNVKKSAEVYFRRAYASERMNDISAAIADYTKCIGLNKNYSDAYWNRASIYFGRKQWALAMSDYKKYSALNKKSAAAVYNIAACTYNQGNKKAAYPIYAKAKGMYKSQRDSDGYNSCVRMMNKINGYYY